ncbi:hypothetical protein GCM10010231_38650 [Streptomyces sindenensis]|nr:hypothetical protein GCM10010231_38650 [Streptomyces sindenensis]
MRLVSGGAPGRSGSPGKRPMHSRWLRDLRGSVAVPRRVVGAETEQSEAAATNRAAPPWRSLCVCPMGHQNGSDQVLLSRGWRLTVEYPSEWGTYVGRGA